MTSELTRAAPRSVSPHRLTSLDGLRGVAALVVVLHHALLTVPTLASAYYPSTGDVTGGSAYWLLTYTPLHLVWAGTEAVCLFFVLSGIVLTLPVVRTGSFSWSAYYPKRMIRLYGPVLAAVLFGLLLVTAVDRYNADALGAWVNARPNGYSLESLGRDTTLVAGASGVISPLWSLQWEVLFSLALPLYVGYARAKVPGWLKLVTVGALICWGSLNNGQYSYYLPMFAVGVLIVVHWDWLATLADQANRRRAAWPVILIVAVVLTCSRWELIGLGVSESTAARQTWISLIGVTLLVWAAAFCPGLRAVLQHRLVQWLGAISFSLYLVHEPIIIAVRFLTVEHSPWLGIVVSIPVALLVAVVFARVVERPLHRLARATGRRLDTVRS